MAVTMAVPATDRAARERYDRLEERVFARDQVGVAQEFYGLVRENRPLPEMVRETVRIHAPYTNVPFHQRQDSGDFRFVNNDHCLLSMRATLRLMGHMPSELSYLPMAQTMWYIPSALDPWNQLLGNAPGHYNRTGIPIANTIQPLIHWPEIHAAPRTDPVQAQLDEWLTLVQRCQVEQAYSIMSTLLQDSANRRQVLAHLMFGSLIDVQDRTLFRTSFTTGHKSYRARATIEIAEKVGWENAHDVIYAGIMDMGVGPHYYAMYEMACNVSRVVFQTKDAQFKKNTKRMTRADVDKTIDVIFHGDELATVRHIVSLLQAGKRVVEILETIQVACAEVILQCGSPLAYNMPMHAYEYCNTLRWFYDNYFEHPHAVKLLFVCASFVNEVANGQRAFPGNEPRNIRAPRSASSLSQGDLLKKIDETIIALQPDDAVGLVQAYLRAGYDTKPLASLVATTCSKWGNDPHNQEIPLCLVEDFGKSSSPERNRLIMAAASFSAGHRKYGDPLESFRRFSEAFGIDTKQDAKGDAPVEEALLDD
ncbi:MAG: hypothetical protein U0821_07040 [Chloroflexota bacterium]